jgi:hypothetical protein
LGRISAPDAVKKPDKELSIYEDGLLKPFFFSPNRGAVKLDPSAGRLAGRAIKAAGTGGNSLGPHTTRRHQLFDIPALAFSRKSA